MAKSEKIFMLDTLVNLANCANGVVSEARTFSRRIGFGLLVALMGTSAANAEKYRETIVLKDGSKYIGYICKQDLNASKITVKTDYYVKSVPTKYFDVEKRNVEFAELDPRLQDCYKALIDNEVQKLELANLSQKSSVENVMNDVILINLSDKITYANVGKGREYELSVSDISEIRHSQRDIDATLGIVDVFKYTEDGKIKTVKGQMLTQEMGGQFTVLPSNGSEVVIPAANVISYKKEALNPNVPLFEQVPTIDCITFEDNTTCSNVFIIERNYKERIIKVQNEQGEENEYLNSSIAIIASEYNQPVEPDEDLLNEKYDGVKRNEQESGNANVESDGYDDINSQMKETVESEDSAPLDNHEEIQSDTESVNADQSDNSNDTDNIATETDDSLKESVETTDQTEDVVETVEEVSDNGDEYEDLSGKKIDSGSHSKPSPDAVASNISNDVIYVGDVSLTPCHAEQKGGYLWVITDSTPTVCPTIPGNNVVQIKMPKNADNEAIVLFQVKQRNLGTKSYPNAFDPNNGKLSNARFPNNKVPANTIVKNYRVEKGLTYAIYRPSDQMVMWFQVQ